MRPNGSDGWGTITLFLPTYPKAQGLAAILGGAIIGPVLEVRIVKILDGYVKKVAILED